MRSSTIRAWSQVHTWTSLVCTGFLLMLCLTGLPLIFHDEIDGALNPATWEAANPDGPLLDLDSLLAGALENRPGEVPIFMSFDIDRTSGALVPPADVGGAVMDFLLQLHTDMFLGLAGMLFLGGMGTLFLAAVISGVVLYAPFMRKLEFGTVRRAQSARLKWLDYHNLLGVVTVAWVLVVGLTGVMNTLATPIIDNWKTHELADLVAPFADAPQPVAFASLDAAVTRAVAEAPGMELQFVAFPGSGFSTDYHYAIFLHGQTPLTEHIIAPALVSAADGRFAGMREMPWYVKALSLSGPLHFGDYGGLLLKLAWAALDVITIIVLGSGLYLWITRIRAKRAVPGRIPAEVS